MEPIKTIKLVVVGDGGRPSPKISLLLSYVEQKSLDDTTYVGTVFDNTTISRVEDGKHIELNLWDTSGQEEYYRLRPLSYACAKVFVLLFTIDSLTSFESIAETWYPEISHHQPGVPIVLVGANVELRDDADAQEEFRMRHGRDMVTKSEGEELAERIHAFKYVECSFKDIQSVNAVFTEAIHAVFDHDERIAKLENEKKQEETQEETQDTSVSLFTWTWEAVMEWPLIKGICSWFQSS